MPPQEMPDKIGRYRVTRELGRGGMGVVYLAVDPFIGRKVAIKTTLTPPPTDPDEFDEYQQAFFNEARSAGRLSHRNIVALYDASVDVDQSYLVMEYVDGPTLNEYCRKGNLMPLQKVINIIFLCSKALHYAHENDVIHRDIKPRNILLDQQGRPKISDFGIATVAGARTSQFQFRETGSVYYSSPEQLRNEKLNPQTDIFSLGMVMFELLTGERPFEAESDVAMFYKVTHEDADSLKSRRPDVPESLDRILARCLARDKKKRYKSGLQLGADLIATFDHLKHLTDELNQEEKIDVLKKIPFFKGFTASELTEVIRATQWVRYPTAATIISEGDVEDFFYILVSGEVVVRKRGQTLAKLKAGDCFGEMAYLGKTKRTASILAASNTILMKLSHKVIDETSISTQLQFYRIFSQTLIKRLAETSDRATRGLF